MKQLLPVTIDGRTTPAELDRALRDQREAIAELQRTPFAGARLAKADVVLPDSTDVPIPHGLGRRAFVLTSPVRGAVTTGHLEEVRNTGHDPAKYVVLRAVGWGASITVDVYVL